MTTLTEYYETVDAKSASVTVVIAGVTLTSAQVKSVAWSFAIGRVPTATIEVVNPPPAAATYFANVYINAGFNGVTTRVFTGKVFHLNPSERSCYIECVGKSWPLDVQYHKVIKTFASITAQTAIEDLLDDAGIIDYAVTMPDWTIGTVCEQTLEFATYGEAINKVAEVDGCRWYEMPTGLVRVEPADPVPALTAWRQYFSMQLTGLTEAYPAGVVAGRPRLRQVRTSQEIRFAKNQAFVKGCTYTQTNPDGTEDSIDVEGDASAPSPWVLKPDGSQAYNDLIFPNELIDLAVKAGTVAARLVTVYNRLYTRITPIIDGDPQLFLAGTVQIEDPDYSGTTGRYFVEAYLMRVDSQNFISNLDVLGGPEAGGAINISPFALFTHVADRQVLGDREWAFVTLDASSSIDPDGEIVSYSWSDNQAPQIATGTEPIFTVQVDPDTLVAPWEVTLEVTDDMGATDEITLTIDIALGMENVYLPSIFLAFDQWFSASPDGAINWDDEADPGGDAPVVISTGAKPSDGVTFGVGWYGTSAGAIYKTEDYCATAPALVMAAVGSPIEHVGPDLNWPGHVWAVTRDGRLYWSDDDGDTWILWDDLRLVFPQYPNMRLSRFATPAPDGVWVFGGTGTGLPFIAYDPVRSHAWGGPALGGELTADLGGEIGPTGPVAIQGSTINGVPDTAYLVALAAADWSRIDTTTSFCHCYVGTCSYFMLKNLAGVLFRILSPRGNECGCLEISLDEGLTWQSSMHLNHEGGTGIYDGVIEVDRAADGTFWLLYHAYSTAKQPSSVYKSPTGLSGSWVLVETFDTYPTFNRGVSIACHPSDPDKIAICMGVYSPGPYMVCYYTTDGGSTWPVNVTAIAWGLAQSVPGHSHMIFGHDNDRLIVIDAYETNIYVSDDWFATWDTAMSTPGSGNDGEYGLVRGRYGEVFACWAGSISGSRIARSQDDGDTWDDDWTTQADLDAISTLVSVAWDSYEQALYTSAGNFSAPPDKIVFKWTLAAGWQDVTYDVAAEVGINAVFDRFLCAPVGGAAAPSDLYIKEAASKEHGELAIILNSEAHTPAVYYTFDIHGDGSDWRRCLACPAKPRGRWIAPDQEGGKFCFAFDDIYIYRGDVSGGVMTSSLAPATLNAEQAPNHGIWIGASIDGLAEVYLVAAMDVVGYLTPGMLYKTFDRFETIGLVRPAAGFPAAPAGARGYFVAISGEASFEKELPPFAIISGTDAASPPIYFRNAAGDVWTTVALPANIAHERPRPVAITELIWFALDVGGFPSPRTKSAGAENNAKASRSADGGATWGDSAIGDEAGGADPLGGLAHVIADAGGWYWGARQAGDGAADPIRTQVYKSDDQGQDQTWDLMTTLSVANASRYPVQLITHPTNQQIIVLVSFMEDDAGHDHRCIIHYTTDRGTTWNTNQPTVVSGDNFVIRNEGPLCAWRFTMLANSRLVAVRGSTAGSANIEYWISDDYGALWTQRETDATVSHVGVLAGRNLLGMKIVVMRAPRAGGAAGSDNVFVSVNMGEDWTELTPQIPAYGTRGNNIDAWYDPNTDTLYFLNGDNNGAGRIWKLRPVNNAGIWEDVTNSLPGTTFPWDSATLIPKAP